MKIKFIIGDLPMGFARDWSGILKWSNHGATPYSYQDYSKIKGLELISDFEKEIIKSRKILNIPKKGMDYKYVVWILDEFVLRNEDERLMLKKIELEEQRINDIFILDNFIKKQIKSLIISDFVFPNACRSNTDGDINYEVFLSEERDENGDINVEGVSINITSPIKKYKLKKFIDNYWKYFSKSINALPKDKFSLSDYEIEIFNLRNQKLPFKTVADEVVKKQNINNITGEINEDSVKTAFHRTEEKLDSLVKRKVTKK